MTNKWKYEKAHTFGKNTAWIISNIFLLLLLLHPHWTLAIIVLIVNNWLYFHGTNTFAYLYEAHYHWKHKHHKT